MKGRRRRKGKQNRRRYAGLWFVLPGFLGVLVFYLIPFLDVVRRSFFSAVGGQFLGFGNYRTVFANQAFQLAAGNTVRFTAACLPLLLTLSFAVALGLRSLISARKFVSVRKSCGKKQREIKPCKAERQPIRKVRPELAGKVRPAGEGKPADKGRPVSARAGHDWETFAAILKSAYLLPMAIPAASMVLLWRLVFDSHGFLNGILVFFGLQGRDWMNTGAAFGVLVFTYLWKNLGYDVVLWMAGLSSVPETVYEAANVDGAGKWACFVYITLPCMKPAIFMVTVISLLNSFKVFREAWMVAGSYPQDSIYLLQHLFNNWFRELSVDKMSAGAVLLSGAIFALILALQGCWEDGG